jgi:probable phosphoglycerate mutase
VLQRLLLVRHGEVDNPDHVVYADLPGFGLSELGRDQAAAAAERIGGSIDLLISSPLQRARETAAAIGARSMVAVESDDRLTEWSLGSRWAGVVWEDLPERFPGEVEAYLAHPADLPFAPESIAAVAARVSAVVEDAGRRHPAGTAALVSHQDPVQAARLALTGRPLEDLPHDKPGHACIIELVPADGRWREVEMWCPMQAAVPFPPPAQTDSDG